MDKNPWVFEDDKTYHSKRHHMSASQLKMLSHSAREYKKHYLDQHEMVDTKAIFKGRAIHAYLLEPEKFRELYFLQPDKEAEEFKDALFTVNDLKAKAKELNLKLKAGSDKESITDQLLEVDHSLIVWDRHIADMSRGKVVISPADQFMLLEVLDAIQNYPQALNMIKNGIPEVSGYWQDPDLQIDGKMRLDMLTDVGGKTYVIEVKSVHEISYYSLRRTIRRLRYDIGAAWYLRGFEKVTTRPAAGFIFFFVQSVSPFNVVLYAADDSIVSMGTYGGENKEDEPGYMQCIDLFHQCTKSGKWPGPQSKVEQMSLV